MIFKNPSKKKSELNLKKGVPVGKTQSLKFLGITLTPHLKWNDHCNSLIESKQQIISIVETLQSKQQRRESFIGIQILDTASFFVLKCLLD